MFLNKYYFKIKYNYFKNRHNNKFISSLTQIFMQSKVINFSFLLLLVVSIVSCNEKAKEIVDSRNPYNLDLITSFEDYKKNIETNPDNELVMLDTIIPDARFDIRYATINNFTGEIIYPAEKAYVRKSVAAALVKVQTELDSLGYTLIIYDAYRPYSASLKFYEVYPDTNFVAAPWLGSRHNRGCAVDVSIADKFTGLEIEMPTLFDDFSEKANPEYKDLPETAVNNRSMLIEIMSKYGFKVYPTEWWHFDFSGWENFDLMDIHFEEL
ncbi:MAG: M15 family metallopeptidase [Candidatus Kapabacteria bacterium]|nr:M15 family metallopeptidase [Ignavibacteriota bacterium]MCW5885197.1 M15 family metallopeptidase [Candidatus Kapabacteria bacterium]